MTDDFHDFELPADAAQGRDRPVQCRAFRVAIERACGPILIDDTLLVAFERCSGKLRETAARKFAAREGHGDGLLLIFAEDLDE